MDRRRFIAAAGAFSISGVTEATEEADKMEIISSVPPLPKDLAASAALPPAPYVELVLAGTAPPSDEEKLTAHQLLIEAPYKCKPIEVAQYFLGIAEGKQGSAARQYAREWPIRANPVIFHFFSATQQKPEGDQTAWCAAFVNWCILRSHAESEDEIGTSHGNYSKSGKPFSTKNMADHSTNDAASGSFRCWQTTVTPKEGEIAVFKNPGTDDLTKVCKGSGHVAFFISAPSPNAIIVLGGNQTSAGSGGAVTLAKWFIGPNSRFMKYVSLK
ncbi:CHAP domain-containing protein [Achromobacter mucicolens]|uniref:CHAP domain-containing protein n=1 Tax=Achromobacter mucicolens TaxID=1389922 RepID=UPI00244AE312|nr:CHAP domain-containing protein [Achromobacter mucicolens]MDH0094196.1 CHAP domain-containing protein [Achromobacter mucicolens]